MTNWQDSLNVQLVNRLARPLHQPGMMKMAMSQRIINRCDRFLNRLPLLSQQMQRWGDKNTLSSDSVPIIYAEPISSAKESGIKSIEQPSVSQNQPSVPLIQRKADSTQINKTTSFDSIVSSSNIYNQISPPVSLETKNNQNSSLLENPISNQFISEELATNQEFTLVKQITSSEQSQDIIQAKQENSSSLPVVNPLNTFYNQAPSSLSLETEINQNPYLSENQITSQFISEELARNQGVSLVQQITSSEQSQDIIQAKQENYSSLPVVNPLNIFYNQAPFSLSLETENNQNSSSLENQIPPQFISEELATNQEITLVKQITKSEQPHDIIQAKQENYSSLPVVNPLNTIAIPKTEQNYNYSENLNSIKTDNIVSQTTSTNYPIVTPQPLTSQVHVTDEEISLTPSFNTSESHYNSDNNIVSVISPIISTVKPQALPLYLAKSPPLSTSINQQSNFSNTASSAKNLPTSVLPKETELSPIANQANSNIDVDIIANQVERKLMRRLVIESERRGIR
jgi:hypothetical protein